MNSILERQQKKRSVLLTARTATVVGCFLLLVIFTLELDKRLMGSAGPAFISGLERSTWILHLYVLFIFYVGIAYGFPGLIVGNALSAVVLIPHGLNISDGSVMSAMFPVFWTMGTGAAAVLLGKKITDNSSLDEAIAWTEKMRRKLQQKIRQNIEHERQLAILYAYSQRVTLCADFEDIIGIGLEIALDTMKVESAAIFTIQEAGDGLHLLASRGLLDEQKVKEQSIKPGEGINGRVAQSGQPQFAYDDQHEQWLDDALKEEGFAAIGVVPLISRGKISGTLSVATRSKHVFSMQEITMLETLGNQLSLAMENALLSNEQKSMQHQLHESEKQFREIFERTNDIIWLEDGDGKIISANTAFISAMGIDAAEVGHLNIYSLVGKYDLGKALTVRHHLLNGTAGEKSYDQKIISRNGDTMTLKVTTNRMALNGTTGFQHIAKDITEEREMHENLQFYIQHITRAQEEERLRISRELHDSTAQSLIAVLHRLEKFLMVNKTLILSDSRFLYDIAEQVKEILQEVRQFSRDLRPSLLDDLGLIPSLEWFIGELNRNTETRIRFRVQGKEPRILPEMRVTLFRIVQEALRNVTKHAEAKSAVVTVTFLDKAIHVTVEDNGKGFDCKPIGELLRDGKLGVAGMHERAKLLGGSIELSSEPGRGTRLDVVIPALGAVLPKAGATG